MIKKFIFGLIILFISYNKEHYPICAEKCAKQPQAGPCYAYMKRYYFDKTEKKCKEFIYGGCEGVVPFETLEECQSCNCK